jgi:hypothetical protein
MGLLKAGVAALQLLPARTVETDVVGSGVLLPEASRAVIGAHPQEPG